MLADVTLCVCVHAQSQLSAGSKALESSEELLELANQTLCSSETHGFTQVTHPASCCSLCCFFFLLFQRPIMDFTVRAYIIESVLSVVSHDFNTATSDFVVFGDNMMGSNSVFSSLRISPFPFPSLLLLSRRPKTLRIGIVHSHPLFPFSPSL